jgi:hypothetical protein
MLAACLIIVIGVFPREVPVIVRLIANCSTSAFP